MFSNLFVGSKTLGKNFYGIDIGWLQTISGPQKTLKIQKSYIVYDHLGGIYEFIVHCLIP